MDITHDCRIQDTHCNNGKSVEHLPEINTAIQKTGVKLCQAVSSTQPLYWTQSKKAGNPGVM